MSDNVRIYVTFWVVKKNIYLFMYLFIIALSTQFLRAEILNYRNYVRNSYDARSEIANVSAIGMPR